jgi:superfamily II DNA/RNA helicase
MTQDQLFEISLNNVINNANWKLTDILIASPVVMNHILDHKDKFDPYDINPSVIVIDEFDEILSMPNLSSNLLAIMRKFASF